MTQGSAAPLRRTALVLLFSLIVRAAALWLGSDTFVDDPDAYSRLAVNYAQSGVYGFESTDGAVRPTAFRPPLYPWLLSFFVSDGQLGDVGVGLLHLAFGALSVWLTLSIGEQLGSRWPWLAACAVAVDPLLLRASQLLMTETLATLTALAVWRLWLSSVPRDGSMNGEARPSRRPRQGWLALSLLGVVLGLSILGRPTAAPWAALCAIALLFVGSPCWKRRGTNCLVVSCGVILCVAPWTARNWIQLGKPIWATSHGGYTLLLANNPTLYQHFIHKGPSRDWDPESFHAAWAKRESHAPSELLEEHYWMNPTAVVPLEVTRQSSELGDDELAYSAAWATIGRQPGVFALSCVYRAGWFWALWPNDWGNSMKTMGIGLWYAVWTLLGLFGLLGVLRSEELRCWLPALLLALTLTALHAVFWGNMRMRAPLMPMVYLLAISYLQRNLRLLDAEVLKLPIRPECRPPRL